jgi:hypothetical protein
VPGARLAESTATAPFVDWIAAPFKVKRAVQVEAERPTLKFESVPETLETFTDEEFEGAEVVIVQSSPPPDVGGLRKSKLGVPPPQDDKTETAATKKARAPD